MGQVVSQMRATSELLLDEFKTVSSVLQSSLREADSIRRDEMCAMASSLTAVEANSQEILKSNQLLGIEIRGLSTHIASGFRDLGNRSLAKWRGPLRPRNNGRTLLTGPPSRPSLICCKID